MNATIVARYRGSDVEATSLFEQDAAEKARQGYRPTSQSWAPGSYSEKAVIVALLLCLIGIGVFVLIYMLIVKSPGTLTVTYDLGSIKSDAEAGG